MFIFSTIKCPYCRNWMPTRNILTFLCCGRFTKNIFTSIYSFNQRFKICINDRWCHTRFSVFIKTLISQCIQKVLQHHKNFYFHIPFYENQVWFLVWKNEGNSNKNNPNVLMLFILIMKNADGFFAVRLCHPSLIGIIKVMISFSWVKLYIEMLARYISIYIYIYINIYIHIFTIRHIKSNCRNDILCKFFIFLHYLTLFRIGVGEGSKNPSLRINLQNFRTFSSNLFVMSV